MSEQVEQITDRQWSYRGHTIMTTRTRGVFGFARWRIYPPADRPGTTWEYRLHVSPPFITPTEQTLLARRDEGLAIAKLAIAKHE